MKRSPCGAMPAAGVDVVTGTRSFLNRVAEQRLALAARAAIKGARVSIYRDGDKLMWGTPGTLPQAIFTAERPSEFRVLEAAVMKVYERMLREAE